jgi:hypothetical protein
MKSTRARRADDSLPRLFSEQFSLDTIKRRVGDSVSCVFWSFPSLQTRKEVYKTGKRKGKAPSQMHRLRGLPMFSRRAPNVFVSLFWF